MQCIVSIRSQRRLRGCRIRSSKLYSKLLEEETRFIASIVECKCFGTFVQLLATSYNQSSQWGSIHMHCNLKYVRPLWNKDMYLRRLRRSVGNVSIRLHEHSLHQTISRYFDLVIIGQNIFLRVWK
jgi:hypothetical protein